jgi:hypothetical protein
VIARRSKAGVISGFVHGFVIFQQTERICYGAAKEVIMASWKVLSVVWEEFGGFSSRQATTRLMYSWANKKVGH